MRRGEEKCCVDRTRLVKRRRRRVLLVVHARLLVVPHDRPGDASNLVTRPARPLVQPQIEVRDRGEELRLGFLRARLRVVARIRAVLYERSERRGGVQRRQLALKGVARRD